MNLKLGAFVLWNWFIFTAGMAVERYAPTDYTNVTVIERRLREVFCEQAMHNGLLKKCDPTFPRYQQD